VSVDLENATTLGTDGLVYTASSVVGRELLTAADAAAGRATLRAANVDWLPVNVKEFGAVGDGAADDTAAIEAAWAAGAGNIYFPPGTYRYNGPGLDSPNCRIAGGGGYHSAILLGPSSYLLQPSTEVGRLELRDLTIQDGKGAVKYAHTGASTNAAKIVTGCRFIDYTECAIAAEGNDSPNWWITENWFLGVEGNTTMGVALAPGLTDNCVIARNEFRRNRIHIKMGSGGNNVVVRDNDFLRNDALNAAGARVEVWVVPDTDTTNSGEGLTITNNRFGSEFVLPGDYRILYADAAAGASNALSWPELGADSAGYVRSHSILANNIAGSADGPCPIIYSTTPNVWELSVRDNHTDLNTTYALEYRTPDSAPNAHSSDNVFGPFYGYLGQYTMSFPVSNQISYGYTDDPNGVLQTRANVTRHHSSGSSASYQNLLTLTLPGFTSYNCTMTMVPDVFGGADAVEIQFTDAGAAAYGNLLTCVPDKPAWVEIDIAQPDSGTPCTAIKLALVEGSNNTIHWTRVVEIPSTAQGWVTYAFPWTPRIPGTFPSLFIQEEHQSVAASRKVKVGRARVYHGNERQLGGGRPAVLAAATDAATTQALVNDLRAKLVALGVVKA
jgi:hypothetical protein